MMQTIILHRKPYPSLDINSFQRANFEIQDKGFPSWVSQGAYSFERRRISNTNAHSITQPLIDC